MTCRQVSSRSLAISLALILSAGCGEPPHVPLMGQLAAPEADVRREAARALGALGPQALQAVPALRTAAADTDSAVRQAACRALGDIGDDSPESLQSLSNNLNDGQLAVRLAAAFALLKLNPSGEEHRTVLTDAMRQGEGGTIVAVGQLGAQGRWAVPTLTTLLRDHRPGIRRISVEALGRIGPDDKATAALQHAAEKDPDDRVREAASTVLKNLTQAVSDPTD